MSFTNLGSIIDQIQSQPTWQGRQRFLRILEHWKSAVGDSVYQQSYPTGIYRNTLQVAVSSSMWAQALSFERHRILDKLLILLGDRYQPIDDIHFSTAKWETKQLETKQRETKQRQAKKVRRKNKDIDTNIVSELIKEHPSYIPPSNGIKQFANPLPPQNAVEAFQRWAALVKTEKTQLPKCPKCHCGTPPGELKRWNMCHICASQNPTKTLPIG